MKFKTLLTVGMILLFVGSATTTMTPAMYDAGDLKLGDLSSIRLQEIPAPADATRVELEYSH